MIFKEDIFNQIRIDFKDTSEDAIEILIDAISKTDYLKTDRVIRCIIFLANGNLDNLRKYIDVAKFDTRDVIFSAEYDNLDGYQNAKRIRDFNKTFNKATKDVKE